MRFLFAFLIVLPSVALAETCVSCIYQTDRADQIPWFRGYCERRIREMSRTQPRLVSRISATFGVDRAGNPMMPLDFHVNEVKNCRDYTVIYSGHGDFSPAYVPVLQSVMERFRGYQNIELEDSSCLGMRPENQQTNYRKLTELGVAPGKRHRVWGNQLCSGTLNGVDYFSWLGYEVTPQATRRVLMPCHNDNPCAEANHGDRFLCTIRERTVSYACRLTVGRGAPYAWEMEDVAEKARPAKAVADRRDAIRH